MWKNEGCGAVFELHQVHHPVEVAHLAQDSWVFIEAGMTFSVSNRLE